MIGKIVCLGDSLTEGYDIKDASEWPQILTDKYHVVNKGISGDTTFGMLSRFSKDVLAENPSHVIIMGGTNDLFYETPILHVISQIATMTRHCRKYKIEVIIGIPPVSYDKTDSETIFLNGLDHSACLNEYRDALKKFCLEDNHLFIDFNDGLRESDFLSDGLHPSEQGHQTIALNVLKALDQLEKSTSV